MTNRRIKLVRSQHWLHGAIAFLLITGCAVPFATARVDGALVYKSGDDGYKWYRIPTMVNAANGDLLVFAEARRVSKDDDSEVDVVVKRSSNEGKSWSKAALVHGSKDFAKFFPAGKSSSITVGNQSPVVDRLDPNHPGRIWMPFTLENDRVFVTFSDDHGATWSPPREITSDVKDERWGWYATGPVHGIQLTRGERRGRLVIPCDHRTRVPGQHARSTAHSAGAHIIYSDDHGATWKLGAVDTREPKSAVHPNENAAVELIDGRIYLNARDENRAGPGARAIAFSSDGGGTYDAPFAHDLQIRMPAVQNSLLRYWATDQGDERNVLIHSGPGEPSSRRDLAIRLSFDEGKTWSKRFVMDSGPVAYSDLVKIGRESVGVVYEAGQELYDEIRFQSFTLKDLTESSQDSAENVGLKRAADGN